MWVDVGRDERHATCRYSTHHLYPCHVPEPHPECREGGPTRGWPHLFERVSCVRVGARCSPNRACPPSCAFCEFLRFRLGLARTRKLARNGTGFITLCDLIVIADLRQRLFPRDTFTTLRWLTIAESLTMSIHPNRRALHKIVVFSSSPSLLFPILVFLAWQPADSGLASIPAFVCRDCAVTFLR